MTSRVEVETFFKRYGSALSAGDASVIAACWEVPAFVLTDEGTVAVQSEQQIQDFFSAALEDYRGNDLVCTQPGAIQSTELSQNLLSVDVQWTVTDTRGNTRPGDHSFYLLRIDDAGKPRIRVTLMRPS
jgi:hypothetical protein